MVKVAIQSVAHGKFVCAEADGRAVCNRDAVGAWETFKIKDHDDSDSKIGFQSVHGLWLSAQPEDQEFKCDFAGENLDIWEYFNVEQAGDGIVYLKTDHGRYFSAQPDSDDSIPADRENTGEWEQFRIMVVFPAE